MNNKVIIIIIIIMFIPKINILKFVYNGLLMSMPSFTYNPINKNSLHAPLFVEPYSTYVNFKLDDSQTDYLNKYIKEYTNDLEMIPIKMNEIEDPSFYINVNIYNCTSPVFPNDNNKIARCEINTYVKNRDGTKGTLILDYLSN